MNQREMDRCKAQLKKFINTSSDAEFDALVAEANKVGFRELSRKLLLVWIEGAKRETSNRDQQVPARGPKRANRCPG